MQVIFNARAGVANELRDLSERRVRFVLRRLNNLVPRVTVQLSDVNGPRGGVDKHCQLMLRTEGRGTVVVAATAREWRTALDSALSRATSLLLRLWQRSRIRREAQRSGIAFEP